MAKCDALEPYLLIPCRDDAADGKATALHSTTGWFETENSPLRINTILFIGSKRRLRTQLVKREGIDIADSDGVYEECFEGVDGLTFPCERPDGSAMIVIWMPSFEWRVVDFETLSHECLHAAVMVMRMSGSKARLFSAKADSEVDDEGLCYRQSTMMSSLLAQMAAKQSKALSRRALAGGKAV